MKRLVLTIAFLMLATVALADVRFLISHPGRYANRVIVVDDQGVEYRYSISNERKNVTPEIVLLDIYRQMSRTKKPWVHSWSLKKVAAENEMKSSVLYNKTNAQIEAYLDNNVTDLATVKAFLKKLTIELRNVIRRLEME